MLVQLIFHGDESQEMGLTPYAKDPSKKERNLLRYQYYIHNGIDAHHVAPMDQKWINKIYKRVPSHLRKNVRKIRHLNHEIKEDYLYYVKKAIVDFVLADPKPIRSEKEKENALPHRAELDIVPKPWHFTFLKCRRIMKVHLHAYSSCMQQALTIWHKYYR